MGADNIYPIYSDEQTTGICYKIISPVVAQNSLHFITHGLANWSLIPNQIKLDSSVISLTERTSLVILKNLDIEIEIVFGLGIRTMGLNGLTMNAAAQVKQTYFIQIMYNR